MTSDKTQMKLQHRVSNMIRMYIGDVLVYIFI